eukprot:gb/GECG01005288.1/.p1 GENE.gb/GECG01005288.1/~~gb/GECG01005288.1/.p1  ORF type:complete len:672 (+),score=75.18 gb/GECG01005288.1/:1-2016(+)
MEDKDSALSSLTRASLWSLLGAAGISVAALIGLRRSRRRLNVAVSHDEPQTRSQADADAGEEGVSPTLRYSIGYRSLGQNAARARHVNYQSPSLSSSSSPHHTAAPPELSLDEKGTEDQNLSYEAAHEQQLQHFERGTTHQTSTKHESGSASPLRFDQTPTVLRFVLTGGPCAGKTTALARLSSFLRHRGYRVYTVPEAATMLFTNGASFRDLDTDDRQIAFQAAVMNTQIHLEDSFARIAMAHAKNIEGSDQKKYPAVLLCDRGTMDGCAYLDKSLWGRLLRNYDIPNEVAIRDQRYNAVFHLVTAANGAEPFYTLDNNATRLESPEQARKLDLQLQRAWNGHPRLMVFDNSTDFEGKLERVVNSLSRLLGLPSSRRCFRKHLLRTPSYPVATNDDGDGEPCFFDPAKLPVPHQTFDVEKVYVTVHSGLETAGGRQHSDTSSKLTPHDLKQKGSSRSPEHLQKVINSWAQDEGASDANKKFLDSSGQQKQAVSSVNQRGTIHSSFGEDVYRDSGNVVRFPYGFLRRRTQGGVSSYGHTLVTLTETSPASGQEAPTLQTIETKRIISASAYFAGKQFQSDPLHLPVRQRRTSFLWNNQYYEITEFISPRPENGLVLLAVQENEDSQASGTDLLPPFLDAVEEVTGREEYSAYYVSLDEEERERRLAASNKT